MSQWCGQNDSLRQNSSHHYLRQNRKPFSGRHLRRASCRKCRRLLPAGATKPHRCDRTLDRGLCSARSMNRALWFKPLAKGLRSRANSQLKLPSLKEPPPVQHAALPLDQTAARFPRRFPYTRGFVVSVQNYDVARKQVAGFARIRTDVHLQSPRFGHEEMQKAEQASPQPSIGGVLPYLAAGLCSDYTSAGV